MTTAALIIAALIATTQPSPEQAIRQAWDGTNQAEKAVRVARCESGLDPHNRHSRTYRGLFQFSRSTWRSVGGTGDPADHSALEQAQRARNLWQKRGWQPWPRCGR